MVTSPSYGSCFSINSNLSGTAGVLWKSSLSGPNLGLRIELNLDQKEYMLNGLTKSAGARLKCYIKKLKLNIFIFNKHYQSSSIIGAGAGAQGKIR